MNKKIILSIFLSGLWITFSEFLRNQILLGYVWEEHYNGLGLTFQTLPINGILWMTWSFLLAIILWKLRTKFSLSQSMFIGWIVAFPLMWITLYNLQVLPMRLLAAALPLSVLEVVIALFIQRAFSRDKMVE